MKVNQPDIEFNEVFHAPWRYRSFNGEGSLIQRLILVVESVVLKRHFMDRHLIVVGDSNPSHRRIHYPEPGYMPIDKLQARIFGQFRIAGVDTASRHGKYGQEERGEKR